MVTCTCMFNVLEKKTKFVTINPLSTRVLHVLYTYKLKVYVLYNNIVHTTLLHCVH